MARDLRRFALYTSESLKARLEDPTATLLPMATHRQGFHQKREAASPLRRAGLGAIAPETLSAELKGMVNKNKVALPLPAEWVEHFGGRRQTGARLAKHRQQDWD